MHLWKPQEFLSGDVSVKKDAAPPLAADAIRMNRRKRGVSGASRKPTSPRTEWKYQLSLPTPRGRSEVRPEVGLPEAPLEREDD